MEKFYCNSDYEEYLKEYESRIFGRLGVSSPSSEREKSYVWLRQEIRLPVNCMQI